jgi:hypothetical protein
MKVVGERFEMLFDVNQEWFEQRLKSAVFKGWVAISFISETLFAKKTQNLRFPYRNDQCSFN